MQSFQFPITIHFPVSTALFDATAINANGNILFYIHREIALMKMDRYLVYPDESQTNLVYSVKNLNFLDFQKPHTFYDAHENKIAKLYQKGFRSMWKKHYEMETEQKEPLFTLREESKIISVLDGYLKRIPLVKYLSGLVFNPSYLITNQAGQPLFRLRKIPSLLENNFELTQIAQSPQVDLPLTLLGIMMFATIERKHG